MLNNDYDTYILPIKSLNMYTDVYSTYKVMSKSLL